MGNEPIYAAGCGVSRRSLLGVTATLAALPTSAALAQASASQSLRGVRAMTFDIQGTLLDYYGPFIRISADLSRRRKLHVNWPGFLADWDAGAASIIRSIIAAEHPWIPLAQVYRQALDRLLSAQGLGSRVDETDRRALMSVWDRMVPWPDSVDGIRRLRRMVTVATLSNASMAAAIALAKRNGLLLDAILTGELMHSYKPSRDVYRTASAYLGFPPEEIMMVATHKPDLEAAKAAGLKTAYIPRPLDVGGRMVVDRSPEAFIDIVADSVIDLSAKFERV